MSPGHHMVWGNQSQFFNIGNVRILQNYRLHRTVFFSLHNLTSHENKQFLKIMIRSPFHTCTHKNKMQKNVLWVGWLPKTYQTITWYAVLIRKSLSQQVLFETCDTPPYPMAEVELYYDHISSQRTLPFFPRSDTCYQFEWYLIEYLCRKDKNQLFMSTKQ